MARRATLGVLMGLAAMTCSPFAAAPVGAQTQASRSTDAATAVYQRTRLILKDGSYQAVLSYKVEGNTVSYRSAERNGELEDIPLKLVDMPATVAWFQQHVAPEGLGQRNERPVLSPELAKAEAERAAMTPEVSANLRLPQDLSLLALDRFEDTPELVPLPQQGTDLNKETAHGVLKQALNPASSPHRILELPHRSADVQLHGTEFSFYVRVGDDLAETGGGFIVDTHGADNNTVRETPTGGAAGSSYVIERLDARLDSRIVNSFRIAWLNSGHKQPEVIETREQELPGGHWLKLTPTEPLEPGEYALIEVVSDHEVNLNVWEFGVHPQAAENLEALRPDVRGPVELKSRKP